MSNRLKTILKSACCGICISIIINICYVLSLYFDYLLYWFYLLPILIAVLIWKMIKVSSVKMLLLSVSVIFFSDIISEFLLLISGVLKFFYFKVHPNAIEVAIGDGIVQVFFYMLAFSGILFGMLLLIISWCAAKYKAKKD